MSDVVVLTAVPAEAAAVLDQFEGAEPVELGPYPGSRVKTGTGLLTVLAGGVGPALAAACAATVLTLDRPGLLVVAGIGGGFTGRAAIGDLAVSDTVVHADLGAEAADGFTPISALGFGADQYAVRPDLVALAASRTGGVVGPIVTVSTVTGSAATTADLVRRYDPVAEGMEGAGGWAAAEPHGVPLLELRAISNQVGPRDRAAWDLPRALATLGRAVADLLREPLL